MLFGKFLCPVLEAFLPKSCFGVLNYLICLLFHNIARPWYHFVTNYTAQSAQLLTLYLFLLQWMHSTIRYEARTNTSL